MSILKTDTELRALIDATGLTYSRLAERFDCHEQTVQGWYRGNRPPRNRGLVVAALQLIVLEQRGVVTAKLIEAIPCLRERLLDSQMRPLPRR